ncbi:MAG: hypothetical protein ACI4XP_05515 [Acutalibacteraceae bacterium]
MSNKELYKKTFSQIHASDDKVMEVIKMADTKKKRKFYSKKLIAAAICAAAIMSVGVVANAATDGEIGRTIISWFSADGTEQQLDADVSYDENGNKVTTFSTNDGADVTINENSDGLYCTIEGETDGSFTYYIPDSDSTSDSDSTVNQK